MIALKDLINRQYKNKYCISFEFPILYDPILKNIPSYVARFVRVAGGTDIITRSERWRITVVIPSFSENMQSSVYDFVFEMPRQNMDLTLICATGLKYFQFKLKEEIEAKIKIDFDIGESVEGM